jgi:Tol biopolymer transport system component
VRFALVLVAASGLAIGAAAVADDAVPLISDPSDEWNPAWSPDGTRIAFDSNRNGSQDVWILTLATGDVFQLTDASGVDGWATWSPDGNWVAFMSDRDGVFHIYKVRATGGEAVPLTSGSANDLNPDWSPDGEWIAYAGGAAPRNIWKVRADGGDPVQLTSTAFPDGNPSYSPDGTEIVFLGRAGSNYSLWKVSSEGGDATPVYESPGFKGDPTWSPDGDWILYAKYEPPVTGERQPLYAYGFDIGAEIPVTDPPEGFQDFYNDWRYDEARGTNRIIFESDRSGNWDIWIMEFSSAIETPEAAVSTSFVAACANVPNPFSPRTAFRLSLRTGVMDARLVVYDAAGRRVRSIPLGDRGEGVFAVEWDGTDDDARELAAGVYLYRIEHANGSGEIQKATLLR